MDKEIVTDYGNLYYAYRKAKSGKKFNSSTARFSNVALDGINIKISHPEEVVKILKQWKADHEKKPIETEFVYIVRIIENKQCVHEEEMVEEPEDEACERVLKKYCEDHKGKFYAVAERICRVKE